MERNMYKVLIADDEKYVRLFLRKCINWNDYGFEVAGEAKNGLDALRQMAELKPDVLVTDMDMPEVDGIRLIEESLSLYPNMSCIVLSGYKDYKYIRTAVQNNVFDYLLKPVKTEELIEVLKKLHDHMEENEAKEIHREREITTLKKSRFLTDLLSHNIIDDDNEEMVAQYGIGGKENCYIVLYCVLNNDEGSKKIEQYYGEPLMRFLIQNIMDEILGSEGLHASLITMEKNIVGVLSYPCQEPPDHERLIETCNLIISQVKKYLGVTISIAIGFEADDVYSVRDSYLAAIHTLNLRVLYGEGMVLSYHNTPIPVNRVLFTDSMEMELVQKIRSTDREGADEVISRLLALIQSDKTPDVFMVKMIYNHVVSIIIKTLYEKGIAPSSINMYEDAMYHSFQSFHSFDQMMDTLKGFIQSAILAITSVSGAKTSYVSQAQEYIGAHLSEDFSISDIANHIHITPNYLCSVFKSETGTTLSDFITRARINKAIEYLAVPKNKISDIYKRVGYSNVKYFCRVFKKITGYAPSEYKKNML